MGTHLKRVTEALLTSTHNICFCLEIRKISVFLDEKSALSVAVLGAQADLAFAVYMIIKVLP